VLVFGLWVIAIYQEIRLFLLDYGFLVFCPWEIFLMSNLVIFAVGIGVTLIAGMGLITSQIFLGYKKPKYNHEPTESIRNIAGYSVR
jgi:hypothetical protein